MTCIVFINRSKSLRASEQRHEKVLNSLKIAEAKAADLFLQQSKTRKKLFSLYSSLQSALASSGKNASVLTAKNITGSEVGTYPVDMTPLLWWRISVLHSFNVGNLSEFTRHALLRKEDELLSRDGADSSHCDNIMPICQYFLLGTCLDEKCPYSHPSQHHGGSDVQSTKKSLDSHFAWILEKHRQYLSKSAEQSLRYSASQKTNAQDYDVDQNILTSDSAHNGRSNSSTEICHVREDSSKKKDSSGRYFNESHSNNLREGGAMTHSEQRSWIQRFIEHCKTALVKHSGSYEDGQGWTTVIDDQLSSSDLPSPPTVTAPSEQKLLSCFCFDLLYGLSYKDQKQRDVCIQSCLQILKPYLDDTSFVSPSLIEAWKLFLIFSLEGNVITQKFCLYWKKLVLHLEKTFPLSLSLQPLLAAVCCRLADAAEQAADKAPSTLSAGLDAGVGAGVCKRYTVRSSPLRILCALWELEKMCDGGWTEDALEALCKHLLLPSPFQLSQQCTVDLHCLPRDLAFATFFSLFMTGQFIGRKLFYCRNTLLVMSEEIKRMAGSRVRNLFRRCPFMREFVRVAFLACFKSVDAFRQLGCVRVRVDAEGGCTEGSSKLLEPSAVTANPTESVAPTAPLSAVDQSILWSYLLLLHCATAEDQVPLGPYQLEEVHRFCDPFCYPGVYGGSAAVRTASSSRMSAHRSDFHIAPDGSPVGHCFSSSTATPSSTSTSASPSPTSQCVQLLAAMDSYLLSTEGCTASLESALLVSNPDITDTAPIDVPQGDSLVSDLCATLDSRGLSDSSLNIVRTLVTWILSFWRANSDCTEFSVSPFTIAFVALCSRFLNEPKIRVTAAVFLNVLYIQILMVVKVACISSRDHSTSVHIIEMVLAVSESTLRIEQSISVTDGAGAGNFAKGLDTSNTGKKKESDEETDSTELKRKRKRGGLELPVLGPIGPSTGNPMQWGGTTSLDCCISELDCVGPSSQTRLLERTLDLLDAYGMMNYNIVELLFQRALPSRGSADLLVQWILDWFRDRDSTPHQDHQDAPTPLDVDQGRRVGVSSSDIIPSRTSMKNSILIATAFQNSRCASSLSFLRRLTPRSLFQLSFHFLRAENFILFSTVQSLLEDGDSCSYKVLQRSFCEADMLSRQIVQYKQYKSNSSNKNRDMDYTEDRDVTKDVIRDCRWTLSENLDLMSQSPEGDSVLQRFQVALNEYQLNRKRTLDLSRLVPQGVSASVPLSVFGGSFPFQSLALFSQRLLVLDISNNFLTAFPPALLFFFQLQKLNLSHNLIKSLPLHLGTDLSDLQYLDLSDNKFCVFPACVLDMKSLEELRIGTNSLEYLPLQVKGLAKLRHLDISNNKFKVLSSDLTHIRFLKT
jgi:Leucine rich repeat